MGTLDQSFLSRTVFAAIAASLFSSSLFGSTIDAISLTVPNHAWESYGPGQGIFIPGLPNSYYLSDGSNWQSGAGTFGTGYVSLISEQDTGSTLNFLFNPPANGIDFQMTDYDGGNHSAQGVFQFASPLILSAQAGSDVATMNGYLRLVSNDPTSYPSFNYFSVPVGSVVPFSITYTLFLPQSYAGPWHSGMFSSSFGYSITGDVNLSTVAAEPPFAPVCVCILVALCGYGKLRRPSYPNGWIGL